MSYSSARRRTPKKSERRLYADDMKASRVVDFCFTNSPPPAIDVFLQRPAAPSAGLLPLCSLTNADEVVILTAPSKTDDAAIEELMAEGLKVRISLAESLGVTAEMQGVGQIGIVKTLDLQRRSFGAAQTIHLSPSLHSTRCQTSRTARPLYPSQISRASLSSYDCNKSPCSL